MDRYFGIEIIVKGISLTSLIGWKKNLSAISYYEQPAVFEPQQDVFLTTGITNYTVINIINISITEEPLFRVS